jgi:hypothetical protein
MRRDIPLPTDLGPDPEPLGTRFGAAMAADFGALPRRRQLQRRIEVLDLPRRPALRRRPVHHRAA